MASRPRRLRCRRQPADSQGVGFEIFILVVALLLALPVGHRYLRRPRDREWERRWKELPLYQRERISTAIRAGKRLEDPVEAELGAGLARDRRALAAVFSQSSVAHLILAGALMAMTIAKAPLSVFLIAFLLLAFFSWAAYRDRVTRRNLARTEEANLMSGGGDNTTAAP